MELCHVGVHFWIVVPDVSLGTPVWDGAEPKRRREVVGTLELNTEKGAVERRACKSSTFQTNL